MRAGVACAIGEWSDASRGRRDICLDRRVRMHLANFFSEQHLLDATECQQPLCIELSTLRPSGRTMKDGSDVRRSSSMMSGYWGRDSRRRTWCLGEDLIGGPSGTRRPYGPERG